MKTALQVGTGGWAASWVPFYERSGCWRLGGVVSRSEEALTRFREEKGVSAVGYTDYRSALQGPFDAVVISAPHDVHVPLAIEALRAGKHVLIEKPLSNSMAAAKELAREARTSAGRVMVSQNFRNREPLWQLRNLIDTRLGAVSSLSVSMIQEYAAYLPKVARKNQVSSLLEEVFIHQADQARFLLRSNAAVVTAEAWADSWDQTGQKNNAHVIAEFASGARFHYHGSWSARGAKTTWAGRWSVLAEKGVAAWDGSDEGGMTSSAPADASPSSAPPPFPGFDRVGILREFSSAIDEHREPMCSLDDNLCSFAMVEAALLSVSRRRPVHLAELLS